MSNLYLKLELDILQQHRSEIFSGYGLVKVEIYLIELFGLEKESLEPKNILQNKKKHKHNVNKSTKPNISHEHSNNKQFNSRIQISR